VSQSVFGSENIVFYIVKSDAIAVMGSDGLPGHGDAISYLNQ